MIFQDIIYKVKTVFNNEFDAAYKQKEFEIIRVKERNVRIQEIILDLELEESVWLPELDDSEKPERTLVVKNSEVLASCFIPSFVSHDRFSCSYLLILFALLGVTAFPVINNKKS